MTNVKVVCLEVAAARTFIHSHYHSPDETYFNEGCLRLA